MFTLLYNHETAQGPSPTSSQLTAFSLEDLLALCYNLPVVGVIPIYPRSVELMRLYFIDALTTKVWSTLRQEPGHVVVANEEFRHGTMKWRLADRKLTGKYTLRWVLLRFLFQ